MLQLLRLTLGICPVVRQGGAWVTPGLIDCHTHLIYAGQRASEWTMKLEGATWEELIESGGGIVSTVQTTRAAGREALLRECGPRLEQLMAEGVTTIEIK